MMIPHATHCMCAVSDDNMRFLIVIFVSGGPTQTMGVDIVVLREVE